jgi:hypothetical protein
LTGQVFGRLVVQSYQGKDQLNRSLWQCKCFCGNYKTAVGVEIVRGNTRSCGCLFREGNSSKHKLRYHPLYSTWCSIKSRCLNTNSQRYRDYGGRGIKICDRWMDSFEDFLKDVGERPEGRSLDRVDNDGDYEPGNVRWATAYEQANNRRPYSKRN